MGASFDKALPYPAEGGALEANVHPFYELVDQYFHLGWWLEAR